ncbi:MAG TPA: DUF255 domain-containing protein, partial [Candidatus Binatus sp.]|nr:DUF255 domain-containing protein [Candidatus Binatus sp.]
MPEIKWQDWNRASFERAKAEGKPILLDIFGSWCHWCHVMDRTSYSDPSVADLVNKNFVPVRVDTDKRPDVNRRYNMGGWPSTVFLDSEGKVITGGTYIPPQQMREVLRSVAGLYQKSKGKITSKLGPVSIPRPAEKEPTSEIIRDIATTVAVNFDIDYGGFGFEPKFPHTDALELALTRYHYADEKEMLTVVSRTLDKMGKGGVYDHVECGFFRYSTTRDWSIPHYEKMAEDNAKLLRVYLHAFQLTRNPFYKEIAEGIIQYLDSYLTNKDNALFYGSQDADEEYYKLDREARKTHGPPKIDQTIYTNYNALLVSSYLLAGHVLKKPNLSQRAIQALGQLATTVVKDDGLLAHYDGQEAPTGLLIDHGLMIHALLDAYSHTSNRDYVEKAVKIADHLLNSLRDPKDGGFFDIPESGSEIGELRTRDKPMDENSVAATALTRLSHVTGEDQYSEASAAALRLFPNDFDRYGTMAAVYGVALDFGLNGPIGITIVGSSKGEQFEKFKEEALDLYDARRSILYLDPSKDSKRIKDVGYKSGPGPVAYVCVGKVCGPPINQPEKIPDS